MVEIFGSGVSMPPYRLLVLVNEIAQRIGQDSLQPARPLVVSHLYLRWVVRLRNEERKDGLTQPFLLKAERPNSSPQAFPASSLVSMTGKPCRKRSWIENPTISRAILRHNDLHSSPICNHVLNQRHLVFKLSPRALSQAVKQFQRIVSLDSRLVAFSAVPCLQTDLDGKGQ